MDLGRASRDSIGFVAMEKGLILSGGRNLTLGTFTDKESGTSLESWALVCLPVGM